MTSLLERLDENGTIELGTVRAGVEVLDGDEARNFYARVSIQYWLPAVSAVALQQAINHVPAG